MNNNRLKEIINNILAQVTNFTDMDKKTYISWLKNEVGITQNELDELGTEGFLPLPVDYEKNYEVDTEIDVEK